MERGIVHLGVADFGVALERMAHPELRTRPVLVAPRARSRAIVLELSPEARSAGIRKGMALTAALKLCPGAAVLPPDEPMYARATRAVLEVLARFSPVMEPAGYGRAYLDLTGSDRLLGCARDVACRARREVSSRLRLETAVGVATNKMVSRIASLCIVPSGLQDVEAGNEASFLAPLPVTVLPGILPGVREMLDELNIARVRDLAGIEPRLLAMAFGRFGLTLQQWARGLDNTPVFTPKAVPAVAENGVLDEDTNDYRALCGKLRQLCARASGRLEAAALQACRVEIRVRYSDFVESRAARRIGPAWRSGALYTQSEPALSRAVERRTRVRALGLSLTELAPIARQLELFSPAESQRAGALEAALDTLRRRFGEKAVQRLG